MLKHDHYHCLYFALKWLNFSNYHHMREVDFGWSKTSLQWDLEHVLQAIVEGLDDDLPWSDEEQRQEWANVYPGIFNSCIGIASIKEYQVVKFKDPVKERRSWSRKKNNRYNFLSVMDHSGHYIFACLSLGAIDKDVFIGSALYLHEGDYFFNHDLWQ